MKSMRKSKKQIRAAITSGALLLAALFHSLLALQVDRRRWWGQDRSRVATNERM